MTDWASLGWPELLDQIRPPSDPDERARAWTVVFRRLKAYAKKSTPKNDEEVSLRITARLFSDDTFFESVRNAKSPEAYLRKALKNAERDDYRERSRLPIESAKQDDLDQLPSKTDQGLSQLVGDEERKYVESGKFALALMNCFAKALEQDVIRIDDFELLKKRSEGMSMQELAEIYDLSQSAIRQRISRATRRFRAVFGRVEMPKLSDDYAARLADELEKIVDAGRKNFGDSDRHAP